MANAKALLEQLESGAITIPNIKEGTVVSGEVIKRGDYGVLVDCENGSFTGMILAKEVKNLERNDYDLGVGQGLEAEILGGDIMSDEGYYIISISKLKQKDVLKNLMASKEADEVMTVIPTEANL